MGRVNVDTLKHFMRLAEYKSISKAAKHSYLSRQALTDTINKLEKELGVVLLNRTKQGITLTDEGKYLFDFLTDLRDPWNNMLSEIRAINCKKKVIRIGLPQFLFSATILSNMTHLTDEMPGYSILIQDYSTGDCAHRLLDNELDIAVTLNYESDKRLVYSPAVSSIHKAFLCVCAASPLAQKNSICKEDLGNQTIVTVEATTMPANNLEDYCRAAKASLRIIPRSHTLIEETIARNEGFFIAPGTAYFHFDRDDIVGIPIIDFPDVFHQHVAFRKASSEVIYDLGKRLLALLETP